VFHKKTPFSFFKIYSNDDQFTQNSGRNADVIMCREYKLDVSTGAVSCYCAL